MSGDVELLSLCVMCPVSTGETTGTGQKMCSVEISLRRYALRMTLFLLSGNH